MESSDYLLTIAEVAVAFVGFAAIVVALREQRSGLAAPDRVLVALLVERGLAAVFFALLPLLLTFLSVRPDLCWRASSGLLFAYLLSVVGRSLRLRLRDPEIRAHAGALTYYSRFTPSVAVAIIQLLAAVGLETFSSLGWYLVGVTWLLALSATIFTTLLGGRAA